MPRKKRASHRRGFGHTRNLPSGRWQASYMGDDGKRHTGPATFDSEMDANEWLSARRRELVTGDWEPPVRAKRVTFKDLATQNVARRQLKPRTRHRYGQIMTADLLPTFAKIPVRAITSEMVDDWHAGLPLDRPTANAQAYSLLSSILKDAVRRGETPVNPCQIRGAGNASRMKQVEPATVPELAELVAGLPQEMQAMGLLAGWCSLRFGEIVALRRRDLDLADGVVRVRRAVVRVPGEIIMGSPKSARGVRDVAFPLGLAPALTTHLATVSDGPDALLFPSRRDLEKPINQSTFHRHYDRARRAAGRPDLAFHELRHTGATMASQEGGTLAEVMHRLGHSTVGAAMRYQHAAKGRDAMLAARLDGRMSGPSSTGAHPIFAGS